MAILAPAPHVTGNPEAIGFETSTRAHAESLAHDLADFEPVLVPTGDGWIVEVARDRVATRLLQQIFGAVSDWLAAHSVASLDVHLGGGRYTLLHPSAAHADRSAESLLRRVIQLQTALDSRVVVEQAKGVLAAKLHVGVEDAFEILRGAARNAGRQLRDFAAEVVVSDELQPEIRRALETWRARG